MVRVTFVCLGNICRSPTAHGIMEALVREHGLEHQIAVDSAGTAAYHAGESPDSRSADTARRRGVELDHAAQQFVAADFDRFDYVLAMDCANRDALLRLARTSEHREKLRLFRSFDPSAPTNAEVPDPYYGGTNGFEDVFDICDRACRGLLAHLRATHLGGVTTP